jgi:methyltransferase family protein
MRVVYLVCGIGTATTLLAEIVGSYWTCNRSGLNAAQLAQARELLPPAFQTSVSSRRVRPKRGYIASRFDLVHRRLLLLYLTEPEQALSEMYNLLEPGAFWSAKTVTQCQQAVCLLRPQHLGRPLGPYRTNSGTELPPSPGSSFGWLSQPTFPSWTSPSINQSWFAARTRGFWRVGGGGSWAGVPRCRTSYERGIGSHAGRNAAASRERDGVFVAPLMVQVWARKAPSCRHGGLRMSFDDLESYLTHLVETAGSLLVRAKRTLRRESLRLERGCA